MKFHRLAYFLRRRKAARSMGVRFSGTSKPASLASIAIANGQRSITSSGNAGHWHDFINVILDDEYGLNELEVTPDSILDLGGNIGLFSLWARDRFPKANIHCYEPNESLHPYLHRNLDGLGVRIYREAVCPSGGTGILSCPSDSRCATVVSGEGGVRLTSLEEVVSRFGGPIELMKMDIEGGEWPLLFDVDKKVFDQVGRIVMEYHETSRYQVGDLESAARRLGFKIERIFPNSGFGITWWIRS